MKTVGIHTLGCKLNYAESAGVAAAFTRNGFALAGDGERADVWIINTCSVTGSADRECRQVIRRIRRRAPDAFIVVTGCYAQLHPELAASLDGVDAVVGSREKGRLFELITDFRRRDVPLVLVSPGDDTHFWGADSSGFGGRTRAFLKIQDGCDYNCSYCVIPQARGRSRSESPGAVEDRARAVVVRGYKEIVLTGVNVGDYGRTSGWSFHDLLCRLEEIEGLRRLRISSIEPNLLTDEILQLASRSSRIAPHFHIPLQSGSNSVLGRMRRRYRKEFYRDRVDAVLSHLPQAGIGVDVIVGFPGETVDEFEETHRFLSELPASYFHVFRYSERENTPAAAMGRVVPAEERARRSAMLRMLGAEKKKQFALKFVGSALPVLLESDYSKDGAAMFGLAPNYLRVRVDADAALENEIVPVFIDGYSGGAACGWLQKREGEKGRES